MIQQGLIAQASWKTNETVEPVIVFKSFNHRHKLQAASLQGIYKNPALSRERLKTIHKRPVYLVYQCQRIFQYVHGFLLESFFNLSLRIE